MDGDDVSYTREEIKLLREGYVMGRIAATHGYVPDGIAKMEAVRCYPIPKKTVQNVLYDIHGYGYRISSISSNIEKTDADNRWTELVSYATSKIIAELVAHPTIEVEDEG